MIIKALAATSAALAAQLSDETGTGAAAFATSPLLVTPIIKGLAEFRDGTNPQTVKFYETYTDASNYSRLSISAPTGGPITFASEAAGTGTAREFKFQGGKFSIIDIGGTNATLAAFTDGHVVFGTYITDRVGNWRVQDSGGGLVDVTNTGGVRWQVNLGTAANTGVFRSADGVVEINNGTAGTLRDLALRSLIGVSGVIGIGGTTSSFPALKRSSAILQARLADDSAFAQLQGKLTTDANAVTGLTAGVLAATTNATITVTDASGQVYRVPCII